MLVMLTVHCQETSVEVSWQAYQATLAEEKYPAALDHLSHAISLAKQSETSDWFMKIPDMMYDSAQAIMSLAPIMSLVCRYKAADLITKHLPSKMSEAEEYVQASLEASYMVDDIRLQVSCYIIPANQCCYWHNMFW
jgi:hypothetical protein